MWGGGFPNFNCSLLKIVNTAEAQPTPIPTSLQPENGLTLQQGLTNAPYQGSGVGISAHLSLYGKGSPRQHLKEWVWCGYRWIKPYLQTLAVLAQAVAKLVACWC
jgi:hypothetical protein